MIGKANRKEFTALQSSSIQPFSNAIDSIQRTHTHIGTTSHNVAVHTLVSRQIAAARLHIRAAQTLRLFFIFGNRQSQSIHRSRLKHKINIKARFSIEQCACACVYVCPTEQTVKNEIREMNVQNNATYNIECMCDITSFIMIKY